MAFSLFEDINPLKENNNTVDTKQATTLVCKFKMQVSSRLIVLKF